MRQQTQTITLNNNSTFFNDQNVYLFPHNYVTNSINKVVIKLIVMCR